MINIESILLFVFVFSILVSLRTVVNFMSSLLQTPPRKLVMTNRELIYNGLSLSYIITYILS